MWFWACAGEKKLGKVIVPDKWKEGASNTNESGGRKINENKLLSKKNRSIPLLPDLSFDSVSPSVAAAIGDSDSVGLISMVRIPRD